jgi:hypothetical protein
MKAEQKKTGRIIHGRTVIKNGRLHDVMGVGAQKGQVVYTGTLKEIRKLLKVD